MFASSPRGLQSLFILPALFSITLVVGSMLPNSPPVAVNDAYNRHGSGLIGPLLANDYDPDNDPMAVNLVTFPAHGSLQSGSGSLFTYTLSDPSWTGTDSFTYQACDNHSACSNTATLLRPVERKVLDARSNRVCRRS